MAETYRIRTKDGIELEVDHDIRPDDPLVKHAVLTERAKRQGEERQARVAERAQNEQQVEQQRFQESESARPWAQRMAANVGAGMMNLAQGVQQLTGNASEEDVTDKRARDKQLADMTTGGSVGQFAGEVLPTMVIPAGAAVKGVSLAGKVFPRALARMLPAGGSTGAAALDASLMGAGAGALQPVAEGESRGFNAGLGAVGGAVLPTAVGAGRRLYRTLSRNGAATRAAEDLSGRAGTAANDAERALAAPGGQDIPLSTAATAGSPELAMAERASRARNPAAWAEKDAETARGVWNNVERSTDNLSDLGAHKSVRQSNWNARMGEMANNVDPAVFKAEAEQFRNLIEQAKRTPQGQNQMRGVLQEISRQFDEMGGDITPQHLAALRARMSGQVKGTPLTDPFRSAPTTDPYYISLRDALDQVLEKSSGGNWSPVNAGYKAESRPVNASRASQAIRERFQTPQGVPVAGEVGGVPKVTEHALARTIASKGESRFGEELAPGTRSRLTRTLDALKAQNITQQVKNAGTGGGGSNTTMDLIASGAQEGVGMAMGLPATVVSSLKALVTQRGDRLMNQELDRLLQNPQQYIDAVRRIQTSGGQLSIPQRQLIAGLQQSIAATPAALIGASNAP